MADWDEVYSRAGIGPLRVRFGSNEAGSSSNRAVREVGLVVVTDDADGGKNKGSIAGNSGPQQKYLSTAL